MNKISLLSFFVSAIIFASVFSCGKAKDTTTSNTDSKSNNSIFVKGAIATKDESFSHIVSNVARLKAMLTGVFVQHNTTRDTARVKTKYSAWLVNEGKDSIVVYQLPVGDFQKIGHWMYQYQIMTSLPDEPIYEVFSKLIEISRDTIKEVYYEAPSDFNIPLEELLNNPNAAFSKINIAKLSLSKDVADVYYIRQTPVYFKGESVFSTTPFPVENPEGFIKSFYEVEPQKVTMGVIHYGKNQDLQGQGPADRLVRIAMMKSDAKK